MKRMWVILVVGLFLMVPIEANSYSQSNTIETAPSSLPPVYAAPNDNVERSPASDNTTFELVQVSHDSPEANEICLKSGENGVYYMGWNDYRDVSWSSGYVHLGFSYSTDGGRTWSENQILGNKTQGDMHDCAGDPLVIPGSGDTVYYMLMEFNESEAYQNSLKHSQLEIMESDDHGQTWISENQIWPYDVDKPWGDYYNGNVYVAWDNVSSSKTEFSHSINGDVSQWTSKIEVPGYNAYPYLAINDTGAIFIATVHWNSGWNQMVVSISTDGGNSFGTQKVVGSVGGNSWEDNPRSGPIPAMAVKGKDIYVVWASNDSYSQVYLSESHDGGENWTVSEVGDVTGDKIRYMYPSVSIGSDGVVHLEYYRMDNSTKEIDVIYRNYTNGNFGDEILVDSWKNQNSFIGDYSSIDYNNVTGDVGIGYTTENPSDNAMFARLIPPIEIKIHSGWNLISLPWLNKSSKIEDALSSVNWSRAMIYEKGRWFTYDKNRPSRYNIGFPSVDNSYGIWVYMENNSTMFGPGTDIGNTNITLHKGWNLVGYPSNTVRNVSTTLSGIAYSYIQTADENGNIIELSGSDLMEPGKGYWIYVSSTQTWTVNW